jgi:hypothetical protein
MGVELALRQGTHSADSRAQRLAVASDSLREIRTQMPMTMDDEWEVEAVVQYRAYCRKEQYGMVWYGSPPTPRQCVLSLRVVASCSVHPVTRVSVQHSYTDRQCNPRLFGDGFVLVTLAMGKEWNRGCLHQTKSSGISLRCTCLALPATRWLDDARERPVHRLIGWKHC